MVMLSPTGSEAIGSPLAVPQSVLSGPRVHLSQRDYLLYGGPISAAAAFYGYPFGQTPNLWWPEDQTWCVASEIELHCTYLGGDTELIQRLLVDPRIEALQVQVADDITIRGDVRNG